MKKIILLLGILGLFIIPCKSQNLANSIERLLAREVEVVKNTTNEVADSSFVVLEMGMYRSFAFDIKMAGGVTVYAYTTLDETLAETTSEGWVDFNTVLFGSLTKTDTHIIVFYGDKFSPVKVMLKFVNSDNTNSNKVIVSKYN